MKLSIPYYNRALTMEADERAEVLVPRAIPSQGKNQDEIVLAAMAAPIGSPTLRELARGCRTATLICSDHTRPVPSRYIVPHMLRELREGNPDIAITLLIATGFHRGTTRGELVSKFGEEIVASERIVIHSSADAASCADIGALPSGARLVINRAAIETDLLVAEGFIEPHFFAGFSGGRKSVLPGVCSQVTVLGNHCAEFIDSPFARTGNLEGNPLHRDMLAAAKLAGLRYIVNTVIDEEKRAVAAFAGDSLEAHARGCAFLSEYARVSPRRPADIVVTSNGGAPLDQNIYQSVKGLTAAEAAAAPGAVLIICAACNDGAGGDSFYRQMRDCASPRQLMEDTLQIPQDATIPDQWEYQILCRIMIKHRVIFVAEPEMAGIIRDMKLEYASTLEAALASAYAEKGAEARLTVIPNGISVIVQQQ